MSEEILKDYKELRMIENIKNAKNYLKQIKELEKEKKELEQKYNDVLKLAKEGMDAQEYCLQEDEEIIRNLKEEHNHYIDIINELKKENEELKHKNENLRIALSTYEMPEVVKVLTDWRTGELQLQENRLNKYKSALEEIRGIADKMYSNDEDEQTFWYKKINELIDEVLK